MQVFGLQTFIWQNNLKSLLLLLFFPLMVTVIGVMILFSFVLISDANTSNSTTTTTSRTNRITNVQPVVKQADPVAETISAIPYVTPFFFLGVGFWFLIAWLFNEKMILALTHGQPLTRESNPRIYNIVENLCISRGLTVPRLYVIEEPGLNAFASGLSPKNAIMCFTRGLIETLSDAELEAVAAHELTHIINRDTRLMLIVIIFVGIIQTMVEVFIRIRVRSSDKKGGEAMLIVFVLQILAFILGFFVSVFVQAAVSRKREFLADAGSVELVKSSQPLISALERIDLNHHVMAVENQNVAQMFIARPMFDDEGGIFAKLFATHPPTEERIAALRSIG
jgi:heat shock protein HtpX